MAVNLNVNGINYAYPETGDTNWGQVTTLWAQAVTNGMLQKAGGSFPLTANVDFGGNFGLISAYFTSRSSNPAQTGAVRLAATDQITFRNTGNTADLPLTIDINNQLTFNGGTIQAISVLDTATIDIDLTLGVLSANIVAGSIDNSMVSSSAAIAYSKLNLTGSILNADINASAAIARSKLAALTASRAMVTDGSGFDSVSATTATELGYVSGVTSAIQTQLNAKLNLSGGTLTGSLLLNADPVSSLEAATKQYVDQLSQGLKVKDPAACATTTNITLSGEQTIDGVLTSSSRVLVKNQSDLKENGVYVSAAGAWTRSTDMDLWSELVQAYVFVQGGTTQAFSGWYCTVLAGGTIGVNDISFAQFSQAGQITSDGQGLLVSGSQISLVLDGTTLSKSGAGLRVNEIANAQIASAAAVAVNKLAALTASRIVGSDGSGFITALDTATYPSLTELSYVKGVTSAIQTQLNTKLTDPMTTNGDLITRSGGSPARLGIGTSGYVLSSNGSAPVWSDPNQNQATQSVSGNVNLTAADTNKYFFVSTAAARSFQLPAPAAGLNFYIKDSTGQAATNNITIVRFASEQIEGVAASKVLQTNWGSWHLMSDGTNWFLV